MRPRSYTLTSERSLMRQSEHRNVSRALRHPASMATTEDWQRLQPLALAAKRCISKRSEHCCPLHELSYNPTYAFFRARNSLPLPTSVLIGTLWAHSGQSASSHDSSATLISAKSLRISPTSCAVTPP